MSSEVCPFCGKTYKRLKSHLPHCKAAPSSKTPPTKHDVTVIQTTSSSQQAAALTKPTAKGEKSTLSVAASPQSKKSRKVSAVSSAPPPSPPSATPVPGANASSSSQSLSLSSASLPPSTKKKKKQKLSEQIKTANMSASTTASLISSPSLTPSLSPTVSTPKKKSLRALAEAAKFKQVSKGSLEGTRSALENPPSGSAPFVADPLSSRTTETKTSPDKDNAHPAFLPADTKPTVASKMKVSKIRKVAQSLSTTDDTSHSLDSRPSVRDDFLEDNKGEIEDFSVSEMFMKSTSGHQARITLQDVKAMLGRANTKSSRPSILSQIETTEDISSKIRPGTSLSLVPLQARHQEDVDNCLVTTKSLPGQLQSTSSQRMELQSDKRESSKSKQAPLIPLRPVGSPQSELTSPATPCLSGPLSSQVSQATSPPLTASVNGGLKVGRRVTGLPATSPSLSQFVSPHLFPQTLPARAETLRADDGLTMEKSQLEVRKQNTGDGETKGALTQQSLAQVRLKELPQWLVYKTPSRPRDVVGMVQRGWQWYYRRYIDVKKGGVGGLGMLLAGYCVLSYIWSYPHIKRDRWRKYH